MKTTYIYLNEYANGYLYVGSHTWNGPVGSSYHGSSRIVNYYGWKPVKEIILEVVDGYKLHRERYWIERYAEQYGIADCVSVYYQFSSKWIARFPKHGKLLNCHSNDAAPAASRAYLKEFRDKQSKTRRINGAMERSLRAATSADAIKRGVVTRLHNARKCRLSDGFVGNGPEITKHTGFKRSTVSSAMTRAYLNGSYICKSLIFYPV